VRQFLAIELAERHRTALLELQRRLRAGNSAWRWSSGEGIHLTLRFLGDVVGERDARARPAWDRATRTVSPFRFRRGSLGAFPSPRRPRVLWVGVLDEPPGSLAGLAAVIERAARESGFSPATRPFHPHLTLARARWGSAARLPAAADPDEASAVTVEELVLFCSEPGPGGARYTALERYPLGRA